MDRMTLLALFSLLLSLTFSWAEEKLLDSSKLQMFVDELPDMPRIHGYEIVNGVPKPKFLNIGMFMKKWKFHRDIPATPVFAFGESENTATIPGPTIEALQGVDTYVTWQNHLPPKHILPWDPSLTTAVPRSKIGVPTVVHLHGGIHEPQVDGNANSWFTAGFNEKGPTWTTETYHYPNQQQPGNLWYHDHTLGLTRVNLLAGLLGSYIIRNHWIEAPLGLPCGNEFDRPLIVFDRNFHIDGSIYLNATGNNPSIHPQWQPEYFGDVIIVNGKAWPKMTVRRHKYRFRIINASNARFFNFSFTNGLDFIHVASDSAYIEKPVMTNSILLGPSEIGDIIVDFSKSKSNFIILSNDAVFPYPTGDPVNKSNSMVMKFFILPNQEVDTSQVPNTLIKYPSGDLSSVTQTRYITMYEYTSVADGPIKLLLNAKPFDAPVTETPKVGSTEIWYVINLTGDNHPLHIHLVLFKVLDQTELVNLEVFKKCMDKRNDVIECHMDNYAQGKRLEVLEHEKGWKNVYKIAPGFVIKILVRFSYIHTNALYAFDATAEPGYLYHCHILDHEDNEMMRPLKLVK